MANRVYLIRQSVDDEGERPDVVTYYDPKGEFKTKEGFERFQKNCCVSAGKPGYPPEQWFVPDLYASKPGKTQISEWDYYMCATFGAFSQRAIDVLIPYFGERFMPLPARLEGQPYFCLHCRSRIDCLDKAKSEIVYYDEYPEEIMKIEKHVFRKTMLADAIVFAIPEAMFHLYATDRIPEIFTNAGLGGFSFQIVDEQT
jgi:hypothetical protein